GPTHEPQQAYLKIGLRGHAFAERGLRAPALADISRDLRHAHDFARLQADRRYRQRNRDQGSVLAPADRLEMLEGFTAPDFGKNLVFFKLALRRNDQTDGLTDDIISAVPEDPLGATVPGGDDAVQVFADDRVLGRGDDRREERGRVDARRRHILRSNSTMGRQMSRLDNPLSTRSVTSRPRARSPDPYGSDNLKTGTTPAVETPMAQFLLRRGS